MENKVSFIDKDGQRQQVALDMTHWRAAEEANMTFREYVNVTFPTAAEGVDTFTQMCASVSLITGNDTKYGVRSMPIKHVLDGPPPMKAGAVVDQTHPVQSRLLFPAFILSWVEDKLQVDRSSALAALNEMVMATTTVPGYRAERAVVSYGRTGGPEDTRSQPTAQLTPPATVLSITAAERQLVIPEMAIAVEISDRAALGATLDLVGIALTRQQEVEGYKAAGEQLLALLQGDPDIGSMASALPQTKANTYDPNITSAGDLTDLAYEKWLYDGLNSRVIDYVITDYAGARAIEHRTGRLTVQDDPARERHTVRSSVFYPNLVENVQIYVVDDSMVSWPANTIMGIDSRAAIHRYNSVAATYSDVERFVMRRGTGFVVSYGQILTRFMDDAFSVLSLTV